MTRDEKNRPVLEIVDTEAALENVETEPAVEVVDKTLGDGDTRPGAFDDGAGADGVALPEVDRELYDFGGELARGGMGRIMYARDRRIGRPVAVKELLYDEPTLAARFEREALLTGRLQHPSIVPVYEAGRWPSGEPFYAMKKVDGRPLDRLIAGAKDLTDRLALLPNIISVAEAIAYAHDKRIIHRDLKPANILVGSFGETVVIDWGLAKDLRVDSGPEAFRPRRARSDSKLTAYGAVLGTPAYMPPEQARGDSVDQRADVYALGAILYHLFAGRPTFTGKSSEEILAKVIEGAPTPLLELDPSVPPDLATIVSKAMAADVEDRYATGAELAAELRRFQAGQRVEAHDYSALALVGRWARRHRAAVAIAATAMLVLAFAIGVAMLRVRAEARQAKASFASLLQELGRRELLERRPLRATAYFKEALAQGLRIDPAFATMIGQVIAPSQTIDAVLDHHSLPVTSIAINSDGSRLWTGSLDETIRVWALPSGDHLASFAIREKVVALALDARDRRLAVATQASVQLLDPDSGEQIAVLVDRVRGADTPSVAFSPDGARIVVAGVQPYGSVFDALTGERLRGLAGHSGKMLVAEFSPDGSAIISAGTDGTARIWDAITFEERVTLEHDSGFGANEIHAAHLRSDNRRAITAGRNGVALVWDVATATEVQRFNTGGVLDDVVYSRDETRIYTQAANVAVWREASAEPLVTLTNPDSAVTAMAVNRDGTRLAALGSHGSQLVWNTGDWSLRGSMRWHREMIGVGAFTADDRLVTGSADWRSAIWRPEGGLLSRVFRANDLWLTGASLYPVEGRVMTVARSGAIIWDARTGERIASVEAPITGAGFDPRHDRLLLMPKKSQGYSLRDGSGVEIATLGPVGDVPEPHIAMASDTVARPRASFSPDGSSIAAVLIGGGAHVWDARTGRHLVKVSDTRFRTGHVEFSADARWLAVTDGSSIALWDAADWTRRWSVEAADVAHIAFAPGSREIVVGDRQGNASIHGLDGSTERRLVGIHKAMISDFAFIELDGDELLLAAGERTVSVSDFATGRLRFRLEHDDQVVTIESDPANARIATTSLDRTIRVWDLRGGREIALFEVPAVREAESLTAAFTSDGSAVMVFLGGAAALWRLAPIAPSAGELSGLRTPWRLEDGKLVRESD